MQCSTSAVSHIVVQPGCIGGLGVWDAIWWTRHGRGWEAVQQEQQEQQEQEQEQERWKMTVWCHPASCFLRAWMSTVKQQSILSLMLHPVASVASSHTESFSSLWNSEMQVFFAHDQVWSIVWGGQAHPRTHRSQLWLVGVLEGEHLIGRENHGESSPSGCVQLRMDRSTLWLVCLIFNGVTWKRFNDPLHS